MRIKKAMWASLALVPATIVPLSTATSCSQTWGYKTPISIGSSIKGSELDPFKEFNGRDELVDLDKKPIADQLQSNFAIDSRTNNYYGYSLPEKWNSDKAVAEEAITGGSIKWKNGAFEDGNAGWYDYSSSDFVKSATRSGDRTLSGTTKGVSETIYSYRNNTLSSVIQLIGNVGTTISSYINYALQYQGTQIGTKYAQASETDTNLGISWGGNLTHGAIDSEQNRIFYESIFASNAVSGTNKYKAAIHPTHVEFTFANSTFPIPAYEAEDDIIKGVNPSTLLLLNNETKTPSQASKQYWSEKSNEVTEKIYNIRTDKTDEYKYTVYTYTNVPVLVTFRSATKAFVDPTKNDSYIVSDYYSTTKDINDTVGNTWKDKMPQFTTGQDATPLYKAYTFRNDSNKKVLTISGDHDERLDSNNLTQRTFVVLTNYAYKEYANHPELDRVTMTGVNTVFPAYFIDVGLDSSLFKTANTTSGGTKGKIFDSDKINKYNNLFVELMKRSAGQGLITEAKSLNDTSKKLLKFLGYMFGDENLAVDTSKFIIPYGLDK